MRPSWRIPSCDKQPKEEIYSSVAKKLLNWQALEKNGKAIGNESWRSWHSVKQMLRVNVARAT
jgi:hypothetical protein